jgi:hypothetical protein
MYAQEISSSRFVELCLGMVVSETSTYFTHTSYFPNTALTSFLFTPLDIHTRHCHKPRNTYVCWVLFQYTDVLSFPVCFSWWGIKNLYVVFPYTVKERVTKTGISAVVQKCIKFCCLNKWCSCSMPLLLQSRCPKQVQISGLGTWTRHSNAQTSQNANSEMTV